MTIPFSLLDRYLKDLSKPLKLIDKDGNKIGEIGLSAIEEYAAAQVICGLGSRRRLRAIKLLISLEEADNEVAKRNRLIGEFRARTPGELLRRMCADRKFTFRERIDYLCPQSGQMVATWITQHKGVLLT